MPGRIFDNFCSVNSVIVATRQTMVPSGRKLVFVARASSISRSFLASDSQCQAENAKGTRSLSRSWL